MLWTSIKFYLSIFLTSIPLMVVLEEKPCRHVVRGIEPPALRGYLKKTGHDTSKILRVLNAFYDRITEESGKEPMSVEEFKYRKLVIREQNKV